MPGACVAQEGDHGQPIANPATEQESTRQLPQSTNAAFAAKEPVCLLSFVAYVAATAKCDLCTLLDQPKNKSGCHVGEMQECDHGK